MPTLVPITPALATVYRQVRLYALKDTPSAFGSTYARESQLTDADWVQRSASLDGQRRIGYVAMDADQACGLCLSFLPDADPTRAEVISMWVAPSHRGTGLSSALLDAIRGWAASRGATMLQLMVTSVNPVAQAFYNRYGFRPTGRTNPYPNDPAIHEVEMALWLV